ncbi:hypothetical protein SYJ56_03825 [Algoriphagus sp. D3-2-R+10]|uniref:hypothetical protein n=1 Tax=Algoriphagus aurantiacus TaxID=3103948 RepID=UPI002B3BDC44|nr:hypothetical protein [Algoriphagus sp. D3-2-R+10]MEB2774418.1 hypothetical protein [Algoriphagus sp. D3-2-R+10]
MKINLVLLFIFVVNSSFSQELKPEKAPSFFYLPVENVLGIIDFDFEVLAKRLRLKNQSSEYHKLERIISWYETKTDSVYEEYKPQLEAIETSYWRKVAEIDDRNDFDQVFAVVRQYTEEVKVYSPPIHSLELELKNWVYGFLSDKQYARWELYLAKKHKEIEPKTPMPMSGPPKEFL